MGGLRGCVALVYGYVAVALLLMGLWRVEPLLMWAVISWAVSAYLLRWDKEEEGW